MNNDRRYVEINSQKEKEGVTGSLWVIPYGNLMTVLMIFFLVLYGYASVGIDIRYEEVISSIQKQFGGVDLSKDTELAGKIQEYLAEQGLQKIASIQIDPHKIRIMLSDPILFDSGRSELKKPAIDILDEVALLISEIPNDIVVEGYTDNVPVSGGRYRSNWHLSAARAFSVIRYFIKNKKSNPKRFSAVGYGEFNPLYPNDTPANKARNRRIEICISRY